MSTGVLLHLRIRHEPGALTRIVSILNPFPVTELSYAVEGEGLARASVRLDADTDVVARVLPRLARLVPVLEVSPRPEAPRSPVRQSLINDSESEPATGLASICA